MKLDARGWEGFRFKVAGWRAVLLYGDNVGLIRERARDLTVAVAGSADDPFAVVELEKARWPDLPNEVASLSLMGGRRVVRVSEVGESVLPHLRTALEGAGPALIVLEAPGLGKGKLRTLAEGNPACVALPCYNDDARSLASFMRSWAQERHVAFDGEAAALLSDLVAGDRALLRAELEKLALYVGEGGRIDTDLVRLCTGETALASGEEAIRAALLGQPIDADRAIERAIADGAEGVGLTRIAIGVIERLLWVRLRSDAGTGVEEAVRALRPPVFFKAVPQYLGAARLWTSTGLARLSAEARLVEIACKQTGSRPEILIRRFVASVARQGSGLATRG